VCLLLVAKHSNVTLIMLNHVTLKHLMLYVAKEKKELNSSWKTECGLENVDDEGGW